MRLQTRLVLAVTSLALAGAGATVAIPAGATPSGGGCYLYGGASFKHGPNATAHAFTYTFTGVVTDCGSSPAGPSQGKIATLVPSHGSGTCANNTSSGVAMVTWSDRSTTITSYTTQSAGAAVVLQGKVLPSYKVGKKVYRTTRDKGDTAFGNLVFDASPQQCTGSGVTTASILGTSALYRTS